MCSKYDHSDIAIRDGKEPTILGFVFDSDSLRIAFRFCSGSEYFSKNRFMIGSSSVKVWFGFCSVRFGSSSMEL